MCITSTAHSKNLSYFQTFMSMLNLYMVPMRGVIDTRPHSYKYHMWFERRRWIKFTEISGPLILSHREKSRWICQLKTSSRSRLCMISALLADNEINEPEADVVKLVYWLFMRAFTLYITVYTHKLGWQSLGRLLLHLNLLFSFTNFNSFTNNFVHFCIL